MILTPEKLPVTVCMLCLNEADRLPRSLAAVGHFAEWLVFDTGSEDDSKEIARTAGATVRERPWEGFSRTRMRHFQEAGQPWILWVDADEVVTPELVEELRGLFQGGTEPPCQAYRLNRMIFFEGRWIRHGDWFPDWNVRLFRQGVWSMEERAVHESVRVEGSVGELASLLEHHSFRSWADKEERSRKYAVLWAGMAAERGRSCGPLSPILRAVWKFIRGYVLKQGFLDGAPGLRIALSNARETALKYRLLRGKS